MFGVRGVVVADGDEGEKLKSEGEIGRSWRRRCREKEEEGGFDEWRGPLSVTDAMANYSWSALRCTAGGAYIVLSGRRISLHPPFASRGEISAERATSSSFWVCCAIQQNHVNGVRLCRPGLNRSPREKAETLYPPRRWVFNGF